MRILAIDQGTSSTKAIVFAEDGAALALAERPVATHAGPGGRAELDPEAMWSSVVEAGREAVAAAGGRIDAVGLANQGETVLAWERATGRPLTPAITWQDRRSAAITERLAPARDELLHLTGLPLDPYFAAPKMAWTRETLTRDGVVTTSDAWLLGRLTGAFVTDVSTASRTMLLDLARVEWSARACELFGLGGEDLPRLVPNTGVVGETSAFGGAVPVAGLAVDQQAALFGEGCHAPGEAKCTYGTGAFLLANAGTEPHVSGAGLAASVAWRSGAETAYCIDGQVYAAGAAVGWLERLGLIEGPADLDAACATANPAGRVTFVPGLAGLAAPFWRPSAGAALTGLDLSTTRADLVRAVVDGIAANVAVLAAAVGDDLDHRVERLRVDGGLTRSRSLMQAQADLAQVRIEVFPSPHATALGVAALARIGIGDEAGARSMTAGWIPVDRYEPRVSGDEARDRVAAWLAVVEATTSKAGDRA